MKLCGEMFFLIIKKMFQKLLIYLLKIYVHLKEIFNLKTINLIIKKLVDTKKVRKKIIKLKQDINKPDFGRS